MRSASAPRREPSSSRPSTAQAATTAQTNRERGAGTPAARASSPRRAGAISPAAAPTMNTTPRNTHRQPATCATYAAEGRAEQRRHAPRPRRRLVKIRGLQSAGVEDQPRHRGRRGTRSTRRRPDPGRPRPPTRTSMVGATNADDQAEGGEHQGRRQGPRQGRDGRSNPSHDPLHHRWPAARRTRARRAPCCPLGRDGRHHRGDRGRLEGDERAEREHGHRRRGVRR